MVEKTVVYGILGHRRTYPKQEIAEELDIIKIERIYRLVTHPCLDTRADFYLTQMKIHATQVTSCWGCPGRNSMGVPCAVIELYFILASTHSLNPDDRIHIVRTGNQHVINAHLN